MVSTQMKTSLYIKMSITDSESLSPSVFEATLKSILFDLCTLVFKAITLYVHAIRDSNFCINCVKIHMILNTFAYHTQYPMPNYHRIVHFGMKYLTIEPCLYSHDKYIGITPYFVVLSNHLQNM